jgi:hypothetical protein
MSLLAGLHPTEQHGCTQRKARRRSMLQECYVKVMHGGDTFLCYTLGTALGSRRTRKTLTACNCAHKCTNELGQIDPDSQHGDENKFLGVYGRKTQPVLACERADGW